MRTDVNNQIICGFKAGRWNAGERNAFLIQRPWTRQERAVVLSRFFGRLCIAVEPVLCGVMLAVLTIGMVSVRTDPQHPHAHNLIVLAPLFALGLIVCVSYAIAVMVAPTRALLQTARPIFIVDGYIRYRTTDERSADDSNGYIAVLTENRDVACEWPTVGYVPLPNCTLPALTEFSAYGGIHKVDGRPTGVLTKKIARFGVGRRGRRRFVV